jgi:hypothetical protein
MGMHTTLYYSEDVPMARTTNFSILDHNDTVIDEIVASCHGDLRGAVKALLLVNEQLESELDHFQWVSWPFGVGRFSPVAPSAMFIRFSRTVTARSRPSLRARSIT